MDNWVDYAYPKVIDRARGDFIYQQLLIDNKVLEERYTKVLEKLAAQEQNAVEDYIASCENMEHRLSQLAYGVGRTEQSVEN